MHGGGQQKHLEAVLGWSARPRGQGPAGAEHRGYEEMPEQPGRDERWLQRRANRGQRNGGWERAGPGRQARQATPGSVRVSSTGRAASV